MIKTYFLKKKLKKNVNELVVKTYPESVENILVICNEFNDQTEEFLGKLEHFFKDHVTIYKVNLSGKETQQDSLVLKRKSISLKGGFKNDAFVELLPKINLVIDLSEMDSLVKNYAISLATHAYKISLNTDFNSVFQLIIKVDSGELNQFFEEFVKYHNALQNG